MSTIHRLRKSVLRPYYKVRHHRGHGIHSPFVFNLITKVIEEKDSYYAYEDIDNFLSQHNVQSTASKEEKLWFRFINYFNAKKIVEIGAFNGITTLYLTATSKQIECKSIETNEINYTQAFSLYKDWNRNITLYKNELPVLYEKQDCIFVNLNYYICDLEKLEAYVLGLTKEDSFIILTGIRTNKENRMLWKKLRKSDQASVSLDLYNSGIIFFNPKLYKRNYIISF